MVGTKRSASAGAVPASKRVRPGAYALRNRKPRSKPSNTRSNNNSRNRTKKKARRYRSYGVKHYFSIPHRFSPWYNKLPIPVPNIVAPSTFLESSKMLQMTPGANAIIYLLVTWSNSDVRCWYIYQNSIQPFTFEALTNSNAIECRAGRMGVSIVNQTASDQVSGSIRVAHLNDPVILNFATANTIDQASVDLLTKICDEDGRIHQYSAASTAAKPLNLHCHCTNLLKYSMHQKYLNHVAGQEATTFGLTQSFTGMSQILIQIRTAANAQSYAIQLLSHDFLRFSEGSLMSGTHRPAPQNHQGFEAHAQAAQAAAARAAAPMALDQRIYNQM
jgi:hypothetical protein